MQSLPFERISMARSCAYTTVMCTFANHATEAVFVFTRTTGINADYAKTLSIMRSDDDLCAPAAYLHLFQ
jgi:hypothetical protein